MADDGGNERSCDLEVAQLRYVSTHTTFDSKIGLCRQLLLQGRMEDSYNDDKNGAFRGKRVRIILYAPADRRSAAEYHNELVATVGGTVHVAPNVTGRTYEFDDITVEDEPIQIALVVSLEAFEAFRKQATEAYDRRRLMRATVRLVGDQLPKSTNILGLICPEDLDISVARKYSVGRFTISETPHNDVLRGRVRRAARAYDGRSHSSISVLITQTRYHVNFERGYRHSISCEGRVINAHGKPYDGADVTVEFAEFELDGDYALPERAFFGEYTYVPKDSTEEYSSTSLWLSLRYVPEDEAALLLPLLTHETGTYVCCHFDLMAK